MSLSLSFCAGRRQRTLELVLTLSSFVALSACGSSYETTKIKDYRLAVLSEDTALKNEFKRLIAEFNSFAGLQVLQYADEPSGANSAIVLTDGLKAREQVDGYGQAMTETRSDSPMSAFGRTPERKVTYSMRVEFDLAYFKTRMGHSTEERYAKQKLFFHEIGHGLEMDHNAEDPSDLMYPKINGTKDFDRFFQQVRAYMQD